MSNDFDEFQKQLNKMFGSGAKSPFGFHAPHEPEPTVPPLEEEEDDVFEKIKNFNLKPREIRDELDRYVIKQDEAKKVLSVAVCDHYNHVRRAISGEDNLGDEYAKQNILVLGPTGVGKTYLLKCIARIIGVPFVKADATKFSETGYVGRDVEDMVRDLVKTADGNVELAEFGIVYIDEIDKLASVTDNGGKDVSGKGVQINLLKLMEEADVSIKSQTDMLGQMESMMDFMNNKSAKKRRQTINTRHILFIVSGAFSKLAESIKNRIVGSKIGFFNDADASGEVSQYLRYVETADLVKYGFEPEFIGRLPVRVACEGLEASDLREILLNSKGSILRQYEEDFAGYGIKFSLEEDAINEIALKAFAEKTGARGLMTVLERVFRSFKFELPSTQIRQFKVNKSTVNAPEKALDKLLEANQDLQRQSLVQDIEDFVERFAREHDFKLKFHKAAINAIVDLSLKSGKTVRAVCEEKFRDFPYGLKLIAEKNQQSTFTITKAVVDNPDKHLSQWVVDLFNQKK